MTERQKTALRLRADDLTFDEIAEKMGISKQRVGQLIDTACERNHASRYKKRNIIYPNIEKWLIEHNMSVTHFARLCGYSNSVPIRNCIIYGHDPRMRTIQSILKITEMPFEVAFERKQEDEQ